MTRCVRVVLPLALLIPHAGCSAPEPPPAPEAASMARSTDGYVDAEDGVRLFYRLVGAGTDTVVVIHGGPGFSMDYFLEDLAPLAERHALLFYDQRGAGRSSLVSDSSALDAQRFAEDLEAIRRHFGMERLTLLGHSWGAGVVALYASRFPERVARLVIVGGVPLEAKLLEDAFEQLEASRDTTTLRLMREWREARLADPGDAEACRAYYVLWFVPFYGDSSAAGRSKGDFCAGTPEALANKVRSVDRYTSASLGEWDWRASLRTLAAPTLVVHGTEDVLPVAGARQWAAALPNARLLLLEGIGHFPYVETPETFFPAVNTFLRRGWPEGARDIDP